MTDGKPGFPGVLWLLPIFFGFVGGVVAALIANLKYGANWGTLFVVGLIVSFLGVLIYVVVFHLLLQEIFNITF